LEYIPLEEVLGKRLCILPINLIAQCLNKSLPESVHMLALEAYHSIFLLHFKWLKEDKVLNDVLAFYSPGLFSFYQFAKLDIKAKFNKIIRDVYLRLGSELLYCLNGLVNILLLGLDDQNVDTINEVRELLTILEQKVSTRILYSTIWLVLYIY